MYLYMYCSQYNPWRLSAIQGCMKQLKCPVFPQTVLTTEVCPYMHYPFWVEWERHASVAYILLIQPWITFLGCISEDFGSFHMFLYACCSFSMTVELHVQTRICEAHHLYMPSRVVCGICPSPLSKDKLPPKSLPLPQTFYATNWEEIVQTGQSQFGDGVICWDSSGSGRARGKSASISISWGNHDCVGQHGVTRTSVALWQRALAWARSMRHHGGWV